MSENLLTGKKIPCQFQSHWFKSFSCLEYLEKNIMFYFSCYLFASKLIEKLETHLLLKNLVV